MNIPLPIPLALLAAICLFTNASTGETSPNDSKFQATWESLKHYECPEWFRDAKFGIWAHWGPQSVPRQGDWYARNMYEEGSADYKDHLARFGHPSTNGWKDIIPLWKAEQWDPDQLMALYRRAGARYFISQAVHCDNFDLWNSRLHKWNAVQMGPKRDIVGDWKKAAQKQGLRFGVSEHLGYSRCWFQTSHRADKSGPMAGVPYDGANTNFVSLYHPAGINGCIYSKDADWHREWHDRMQDLLDNYQPDFLYTDGGVPFGQVGIELVAHFYNNNIRSHGGKLEAVYTSKDMQTGGEFVTGTCVQDVERGAMREIQPNPWQTDTSNGDWYFRENDTYKTAGDVVRLLADIVSKNGNLLLNVVQYPDGSLPPQSLKLLDDLASWMKVNSPAIFSTRPWKVCGEGPTVVTGGHFKEDYSFTAKDIRFTTRNGKLYAIALGLPADGKLLVRSLARIPGDEAANAVTDVRLLGSTAPATWSQSTNGLAIRLPPQLPSQYTVAFEVVGTQLKPAPMDKTN